MQRLCGKQKRKPGGGRKRLGTRPEYVDTLKRVVLMQALTSPLSYCTLSARNIAGAMKQQGHPCAPATVPILAEAIGIRTHERIEPSARIKPIKPEAQFDFVGRRLEDILSKQSGIALLVTADLQHGTPCNCPANRLEAWRSQALAAHIQEILTALREGFAKRNTSELMLVVEGGGLLGLHNTNLPRSLQSFADLAGITIFLSHLPPGMSRISTDVLAEEVLELTKEQWTLGAVRLRVSKVKAMFRPSNPQDGNFRPTAWNRIFVP
jgi:hypothetical protein